MLKCSCLIEKKKKKEEKPLTLPLVRKDKTAGWRRISTIAQRQDIKEVDPKGNVCHPVSLDTWHVFGLQRLWKRHLVGKKTVSLHGQRAVKINA